MARPWVAVGGLVALAAALRVLGLDAKGFWEDEALTVFEVRMGLWDMLSSLTDREDNPPLYYALAWTWTRVFGEGEVGIRSLSVLCGTLTVPVAFLAARELVSDRAGIAAAALIAVNPLLVWYSQEARSYALLVLLSTVALHFFARTLRDPSPRNLVLWSLASTLALTTHYFAVFPFVVEAAWLLWALGARRRLLAAVATPCVIGAALIPLALAQAEGPRHWIEGIGLLGRIAQVPGFFLVGFEASLPFVLALAAAAALAAAVGLLLLVTRASEAERRGGELAGGLGVLTILIPLALALVGLDYFVYRNVIVSLVPLVIAVAAGLGAVRAGRAGPAAALVLIGLSIAIVVATAYEPKYQRETWREAATAIGDHSGARAIVSTPGPPGREPLQVVYLPDTTVMNSGIARLAEIDLLALPRRELGEIANARLPEVGDPPEAPVPGFRLAEARRDEHLLLFRYRAPRPRPVSYEALESLGLDDGASSLVLLERARVR